MVHRFLSFSYWMTHLLCTEIIRNDAGRVPLILLALCILLGHACRATHAPREALVHRVHMHVVRVVVVHDPIVGARAHVLRRGAGVLHDVAAIVCDTHGPRLVFDPPV